MNNVEPISSRDEFDDWCSKWDKAQKEGVFDGVPRKVPSPLTAQSSFFGMTDVDDKGLDDADSEYWNKVYAVSTGDPEVISEAMQTKEERAKKAENIAAAANPIRQASEGEDQDVTPKAMNHKLDPHDIERLAEMKEQLHKMQNEVAKLGSGGSKIQPKIDALQKKIDELSNELTQGYDISPQGD